MQRTSILQQQIKFFNHIHACQEERKTRKKLVGEKKTPFTKFEHKSDDEDSIEDPEDDDQDKNDVRYVF
jgi:hypothetical protein